MAVIGMILGNRYVPVKVIGRGGMSVVYLVRDLRLNKAWALKEITSDDHVLMAEAEILKRLEHPALPRIVDIFEQEKRTCLVMDYVEGETLESLRKRGYVPPEEVALNWMKQLASVLHYLHSQKPPIIYGDLKPSNIILTPGGRLKLIDFGIAKIDAKGDTHEEITYGTKGFAPPESYRPGAADIRSDIYSLGMTIHCLFTGDDPRDRGYVYHPVRYFRPEISKQTEEILEKCMAKDPDRRFSNCKELTKALLPVSDKEKEQRKRKAFTKRIFAILLLGLICAGIFWHGQKEMAYRQCIAVSEADAYAKKKENYIRAIELFPKRQEGYEKLLSAYEEKGHFTRADSEEFLRLYNETATILPKEGASVAELYFRIGRLYLTIYEDETERIRKAAPFFALAKEAGEGLNGYPQKSICECDALICTFYQSYMLDHVEKKEVSVGEYERIFQRIKEVYPTLADENAYDRLSFGYGVFLFLYDQRHLMAAVGVREDEVMALFDEIYQEMEKTDVRRGSSLLLKEEMQSNYIPFRQGMAAAFEKEKM